MKIIHFIYDHVDNPWVGGGGAVRAWELDRRLAANGHEVTLVSGRYPDAADYASEGIQQRFVGTGKNNYVLSTFCYAAQSVGYLHQHAREADVVVEDFAPYNPIFAHFMSRGRPVVLQVHHRESWELFSRYNVLGFPFMLSEALYPKFFRHAVAVSDESRRKFDLPRAEVVPNGIDPELLRVKSSDEGYICFMGRLHEHNKGLDTLLEALSRCEGLRLVIAGRGPDEQTLKQKAERMGLGGRVEFHGFLNETEKRSLAAAASLFVLPSRYEGQGIVVLEAAALGTSVVVSDIAELDYAVKAGFAVSSPVGNAQSLASSITSLMNDRPRREKMAKLGRAYAAQFTWDHIVDIYERVLGDAVESGR